MPEKTKPKDDDQKCQETAVRKKTDGTNPLEGGARSRNEQEKSYYYDDAHGYEIYNPDEDEDA
jgi:hypothetical protein